MEQTDSQLGHQNGESGGQHSDPLAHSSPNAQDHKNNQPNEFCFSMITFLQPDSLVTNLQGKILFATIKFSERLETSELRNTSLLEFIPLKKQQDVLFAFKALSSDTGEKELTLSLMARSGKQIKLPVSLRRFSDERNKPLLLITPLAQPVSADEKDDEIHRLREIIEQSPLSLVITDLEANISYVNAQFERVTGYSKEEVAGKNPKLLSSGETPRIMYEELWETLTAGKTWKGEFRNKRKNGELFWELATISPLRNDAGKATHYIAIKEDITVRKAIFEKFAEGEEQLRIIVESTGDVIYKYSYLDDCYEYMNPAIARMTGYSVEELNVIKLSGIVEEVCVLNEDPEHAGGIYGARGDYRAEYLIRTKSGEMKWIEDHSYPRYDEKHLLVGSVGILSDISLRKTTELELTQAKEEAESMNRLKDVFLSNMSHELRTPMISMIGYSEILQELTNDEETKEISSILHQSALRLTDTINTILDLSMLESGSLFLQLNKVDIGAVMKQIATQYNERAGKKGVALLNDVPGETFYVEADQRLLSQVIDNLLNNALKYTHNGSVTCSVAANNGSIVLSVSDTGIGIKKEFYNLIFEEFRQVSEGLDRRYEGSGLGLHVSKRFVEKMNGKIWVESEFGKGSSFHILLKAFSDR